MDRENRSVVIKPVPDLSMLAASLLHPVQEELLAELADSGHPKLRACHGVVLGHLTNSDERLTRLAELCGQPKQYVLRLIDELEALGYVERRPDPRDRRGKLIAVTERGRVQQEDAALILARIEARFADRIGHEKYAQFRRLLSEVVLCEDGEAPTEQAAMSLPHSGRL